MRKLNVDYNDIYLVEATTKSLNLVKWLKKQQTDFNWIYLSDDYLSYQAYQQSLKNLATEIPVSKTLHQIALDTRRPYIKWIASAGVARSKEYWWASRVTEKNTMISTTFTDICRLKLLYQILLEKKKPILLINASAALAKTIKSDARFLTRVKPLPIWLIIYANWKTRAKAAAVDNPQLMFILKFTLSVMKYAGIYFNQKLKGKLKHHQNRNKVVLRHTYVSKSQFIIEQKFNDIYFPNIDEYLKSHGYEPLVLAVLTGTRSDRKNLITKLSNSKTNFINPHSLYKFLDYLYAFWVAFQTHKVRNQLAFFDEINAFHIISAEALTTAFDNIENILYLRLAKRLTENGYEINAMISEFENMIPEKMLILGFQKYIPKAELIGFQHSALFPLLLCLFTPIEERSFAPMHDKVICNGEFFREILVSEGFPEHRAVVGASLRYSHLWKLQESVREEKRHIEYDIVIPLSLSLPNTLELLTKSISAFAKDDLKVAVKSHPMYSLEMVLHKTGLKALPDNFCAITDNLGEILAASKVMVGFATTAAFEAVALGIPVVRLRSDVSISLDPLEYFGSTFPEATTANELLAIVNDVLSWEDERLARYKVSCEQIINASFTKKNDDSMMHFLPGSK